MPKPRLLTLLIPYFNLFIHEPPPVSRALGWLVGWLVRLTVALSEEEDVAIERSGERTAAVILGERRGANRTVNVSFINVDVDLFVPPPSLQRQASSLSSPLAEGSADRPAGLPTEAVPSASARARLVTVREISAPT